MMPARKLESGSPYLSDESKMTGRADMLYMPENESEVIGILKDSVKNGRKITVSSMRTGVCGGAVPEGGDVLGMEMMNRAVGIGKDDRGFFIRVRPAMTVNELNALISKKAFSDLDELTPGAVEEAMKTPLFYPVDPTELNSSIGGNISTNASGPRTFKYGPTRNWVRMIRIVLSTGKVLDLKRGDVIAKDNVLDLGEGYAVRVPSYDFRLGIKNATGIMASPDLDAVDLFVGSEGIIGVITEADVYLAPWHPLISNIMFFPDDVSSYGFVKDLRDSDVVPEFLEYFDGGSLNLIRESRISDPKFTGMPDIPEKAGSAVFFDLPYDGSVYGSYDVIGKIAEKYGGSLDDSWCGHEQNDRQRFFAFRHSVPQSIFDHVAKIKQKNDVNIHKMGTDMSVPLDKLDRMMEIYRETLKKYDLRYVIFGHIGNGHLHVEIMIKSMDDVDRAKTAYRELARAAMDLGGSPSAEHGIGKLKNEYITMMYGEKGAEEIKAAKDVLDPTWTLNVGNMVIR
jgi:D-lactate dehydrogenase (cytochrome)